MNARRWFGSRALRAFALGAIAFGVLPLGDAAARTEQSLLWNPGPRWGAGLTLAVGGTDNCTYWGSGLSEAPFVGNPAGGAPVGYRCAGGDVLPASNGAAPTYYHDTRQGWTPTSLNVHPGWSIWGEGGAGTPFRLTYLNHAASMPEACTLREVGLVYQKWAHQPHSHFRLRADGEHFRIGDFDRVLTRVRAQVYEGVGPPRCQLPGQQTAYVTVDFRFFYQRPGGPVVREGLLGVLLHVLPGAWTPAPPTPVFWSDFGASGDRMLLLGGRLSPAVHQLAPNAGWHDYEIDFAPLIAQYLPPPPGFTVDDAIPAGLDIYTSTRGADLDFAVNGADLVGVND